MNAALPLAFYGTLRSGGGALENLGIAERMTSLGPCVIRGRIHDLEGYPGLEEGEGRVIGELFALPDIQTLAILDGWEVFHADNLAESLYHRVTVRLIEPEIDAQVYVYNRPLNGAPLIQSGDWLAWQAEHV